MEERSWRTEFMENGVRMIRTEDWITESEEHDGAIGDPSVLPFALSLANTECLLKYPMLF